MPIYCARVHLIALSYSLIPTTNEDSSLCECADRRPLRVCADLCPREMCANTHKSRLLGSVTGRESALSVCVRGRAGRNCRFFRRARGKQPWWHFTSYNVSAPGLCARSLRTSKHFSVFPGVLEAALLHLIVAPHCCVIIECLHSAHRLIDCVCVWCVGDRGGEGRWLLKRFMLKRLWLDDGITTKVPAATHYSLVLQSMRILIIWKGRNTIVAKPALMR